MKMGEHFHEMAGKCQVSDCYHIIIHTESKQSRDASMTHDQPPLIHAGLTV